LRSRAMSTSAIATNREPKMICAYSVSGERVDISGVTIEQLRSGERDDIVIMSDLDDLLCVVRHTRVGTVHDWDFDGSAEAPRVGTVHDWDFDGSAEAHRSVKIAYFEIFLKVSTPDMFVTDVWTLAEVWVTPWGQCHKVWDKNHLARSVKPETHWTMIDKKGETITEGNIFDIIDGDGKPVKRIPQRLTDINEVRSALCASGLFEGTEFTLDQVDHRVTVALGLGLINSEFSLGGNVAISIIETLKTAGFSVTPNTWQTLHIGEDCTVGAKKGRKARGNVVCKPRLTVSESDLLDSIARNRGMPRSDLVAEIVRGWLARYPS
jgi:hypothetical protein